MLFWDELCPTDVCSLLLKTLQHGSLLWRKLLVCIHTSVVKRKAPIFFANQPLAENLCRIGVKVTLKPDIGCRTIYKRLNDQSRGHVESTREYNFRSLSIWKITLWSFRCLFVLRFRGLKTYPHADAKQRKTKKWPHSGLVINKINNASYFKTC